jgi:hypothetical protein
MAAVVALAAGSAILLPGCSRTRLELDPAVLSGCPSQRGRVIQVTWDASRATTGRVVIKFAQPGSKPRAWRTELPTGSALTGPWGKDGLTVLLVSAQGRELARRTLVASPCARTSHR